jgi:hypothetical protein
MMCCGVVWCDVMCCVVVEGIAAFGWESGVVRSVGGVCLWCVVAEVVALDGVGCRGVLCVFVGCSRCSLSNNKIGDDGARAIGAALQYLPSLTVLLYVRSMGHAEEAKEE